MVCRGAIYKRMLALLLALSMIALPTLTAAEAGGLPALEELWETPLFQNFYKEGIIADFTGDGVDDVMAIRETRVGNGNMTHSITLFDGRDGSAVWRNDYPVEYVHVGTGHVIDRKKGSDLLIYTAKNPWNISLDYPYFGLEFELQVLKGSDGTQLWNRSGMYLMHAEQVRVGGRNLLLIAGNYGYGSDQELCVLDLDKMSFMSTHISLPIYSPQPFIVEKLPDGRDIVIIEGDAAVEAYDIKDWTLAWEYDYFDNEVYFSEGWTGLTTAGDGRVAFQARKNETFSAIIVLDASDGSEVLVIDQSIAGLSLSRLIKCGFFNQDRTADYMIYGHTDSLEAALAVLDGKDGSLVWKENAPFSIYYSEPLTIRFGDMDADGFEDILVVCEENLTIVSGIDGKILWEHATQATPQYHIVADTLNSGKLNIVFAFDDALRAYSLSYEVEESGGIVIFIILIFVATIAVTSVLVLLRGRRVRLARQDENPHADEREQPPT